MVVKQLKQSAGATHPQIKEFFREVEILKEMVHPNLLALYGVISHPSEEGVAMSMVLEGEPFLVTVLPPPAGSCVFSLSAALFVFLLSFVRSICVGRSCFGTSLHRNVVVVRVQSGVAMHRGNHQLTWPLTPLTH